MDFARKQLEKYGWTDGKGLGKNENGISQPLKPKLKRSVAGIGHDLATEHTEHWWNQLYDKAAKNVEVEEKNGKTKKIKTKESNFKITNSTYHLNKSDSATKEEEYSDFFVRTAVLTSGGSKVEKIRESDSEEEVKPQVVFKMSDEELFAACEGRTAHKGARHGLTATGKLARIERQEQMLLDLPKYNGYSHKKKNKKDKSSNAELDLEVVENTNLMDQGDCTEIKKKKKKRKHCLEGAFNVVDSEKKWSDDVEMAGKDDVERKNQDHVEENQNDEEHIQPIKKKKKHRREENMEEDAKEIEIKTKKKKKKLLES